MRLLLASLLVSSALAAQPNKPDLIGGAVVNRAAYPELVRISNGGAYCSASLIGPRVLLTAAHCTKPDGQVVPVSEDVEYDVDHVAGGAYKAVCDIAPLYQSQDHDMALCLIDSAVQSQYASVSARVPKLGEKVSLSGFGCTGSDGRGGNNGSLKVGLAPVVQLPNEAQKDYWFQTKGSSALCYGDSGGPAFEQLAPHKAKMVLGVNSRGDIKELSLLTSLGLKASQDFLRAFEKAHGVQICGVSAQCAVGKP